MVLRNKESNALIARIAEELHMDKRVVGNIIHHSFEFKARVIRDPDNLRPIRDRYLGIFAIRTGLKKKE